MTSMNDISALIDSYTNETVAQATKPLLDSIEQMKVTNADLLSQLNEYIQTYGTNPEPIYLPDNFPTSKSGLLSAKGFTGKGIDRTIYRMHDNSSTRAAEIAAIVKPKTNPFHMLRMGGADLDHPVDNARATDFSLIGPNLGHTFGGLFVGPGRYALAKNLDISAIQGKLNGPPEETGSLVVWGQTGMVIDSVMLDGRNEYGAPIASSMLMLSACWDTTIFDTTFGYAQYGFGAALWHCGGYTRFLGGLFRGNRKSVNIEQAEPNSVFEFRNCSFEKPVGSTYSMQISTYKKGRAYVNIYDPIGDAPVVVKTFGPAANGGQNGMLDSDIKVYVAGKDVTSSRLQIVH